MEKSMNLKERNLIVTRLVLKQKIVEKLNEYEEMNKFEYLTDYELSYFIIMNNE